MAFDREQIVDVKVFTAKSSASHRIADATHDLSEIRFYVTEVRLASGTTGQGYLLSFHYFPQTIAGALRDTAEFAKQFKCYETVRMNQAFADESEYFGRSGVLKWAQGTLNLAMWDAWGKSNELPVWKMLGAGRTRIPVYGSGGWLSYSDDELLAEVAGYKERGFRAVKIKVGAPDMERDLHRLRLVRDAVGDDVQIMMDANQGMDVSAAIRLADRASALDIHWFEEPVDHTNYAGFETIRQSSRISIAMGEREFDTQSLERLCERNAIDLWQPDIVRMGGVEAWRESAAVARAHSIPVLPHFYKDYDVPLLCTISNGYAAESFDWIDGLIDEPMVIEDGFARVRRAPGWGFSFLPAKLEEV